MKIINKNVEMLQRSISNNKNKKAFTLVELIIVITILAILAMIAFLSFQNYTKDARDANRTATIKNIEKALSLYKVKIGSYPAPDDYITISALGTDIGYQGKAGESVLKTINMSLGIDPLDKTYYTYSTNIKKDKYQLLGFLEDATAYNNINKLIISNVYALDYSKRKLDSKGNTLGILINVTTHEPIENQKSTSFTGVDIVNTNNKYKAIFDNSINGNITGTGIVLLSLITSFKYNAYCPTGFIYIPGSQNVDGQTKGWCVMKYEASYVNHTAGQSNCYNAEPYSIVGDCTSSTARGNSNISSKANSAVINYISRNEAQGLCSGYLKDQNGNTISNGKLLTVQLWKKISDDIVNQNINWTGNTPGSGNMSRGHANNGPATTLKTGVDTNWIAKQTKTNGNYYFTREWTLSNGSTINDFAGNLWEWYYDVHFGGSCSWKEFTANNFTFNFMSLEPSDNTYNSTQGIGKICTANHIIPTGTSSASVFGGYWTDTTSAGIFSSRFSTYFPTTSRGYHIGFRCIAPAQ